MFIAFPLNAKPSWRHPPVWTLLLILLNCIVFFGPQRLDAEREEKARYFYVRSDLPGIELPLFIQAFKHRTDKASAEYMPHVDRMYANRHYQPLLDLMEADAAFMARLRSGQIVTPDQDIHGRWQRQREEYERLRGERFTERWMTLPDLQRPETMLTATFLHGSTSHLVGNMIFLFAFGYTVEMSLGGLVFLLFYLLAGVCGDLLHTATHWGATQGSIGASGAIAGLMAMYAGLYGRRKISFFYLLFFYFDKVRAPALLLLPVWLANEVLQFILVKGSHIGYMAHAGGLLGGALLIFAYKWWRPQVSAPADVPTRADEAAALGRRLAEVHKHLEKLDFSAAQEMLADLSRQYPQNLDVLQQYRNVSRLDPASDHYHRSSQLVLGLRAQDTETLAWMRDIWLDYLKHARPFPRISADALTRLGMMLLHAGYVEDASGIEVMLRRLSTDKSQLDALRLGIVRANVRLGSLDKAGSLAQLMNSESPGSPEARLAQECLSG